MAKTKEGTRPFENQERAQTLELLYQAHRGLEKDKAQIKKRKETIDQLMAELAMGGRADVNQGSLPLGDTDPDEDGLSGDGEKPASDKPPPMHAAQQQAKKKATKANGAAEHA